MDHPGSVKTTGLDTSGFSTTADTLVYVDAPLVGSWVEAVKIYDISDTPDPLSMIMNPSIEGNTIAFTVYLDPSAGVTLSNVSVIIFDSNEDTVKFAYYNGSPAEGAYSVLWDGTTDTGNYAPDAVYRYKILARGKKGANPIFSVCWGEIKVLNVNFSPDTGTYNNPSNATFTVTPIPASQSGAYGVDDGILGIYEILPSGVVFSPAALTKFYYLDSDNDGIVDNTATSETDLVVSKYTGGSWVPLSTISQDTTANYIEVALPSLSIYGLLSKNTGETTGPEIDSIVDIEPHTLNLRNLRKWISLFIEIPGLVHKIIPSSVTVQGVHISADNDALDLGDYDKDGIDDAMFYFDSMLLQDVLEPGKNIVLAVKGKLEGGGVFSGSAIIKIKMPK